MKILSFLAVFLILIGSASAFDGSVTKPAENKLIMTYDQEIRTLYNSTMAWSEDTPIQFFETDREVEVEYEILNNNFFTLKVTNSPFGTEREYSFIYCTIHEIPDYDRFRYHQENRCREGFTAYKLRDIRQGQKINVKIPPLINNTNAYEWYVGKGAGGGGGLPICEDIIAGLTLNQTSGTIVFQTKMTASAGFQGSSSVGCSVNRIEWQFYSIPAWKVIPQNNNTEALDCNGALCYKTISTYGTWNRYANCDIEKTVSLRSMVRGSTPTARTRYAYSPTRYLTCDAPIIETETPFHHAPNNDRDKSIYFLPFAFVILAGFVITRKKKDEELN